MTIFLSASEMGLLDFLGDFMRVSVFGLALLKALECAVEIEW